MAEHESTRPETASSMSWRASSAAEAYPLMEAAQNSLKVVK